MRSAQQEGFGMKLDDLERCVAAVLKLARDRGIDAVDPGESDFYWTITSPEWLVLVEPPVPAMGSFADDHAELAKLLERPQDANAVDIERVAHCLMLLSDLVAGFSR
jgi:hypothetical protein